MHVKAGVYVLQDSKVVIEKSTIECVGPDILVAEIKFYRRSSFAADTMANSSTAEMSVILLFNCDSSCLKAKLARPCPLLSKERV